MNRIRYVNQRANRKEGRQLTSVPYKAKLPLDPPSINSSAPREAVIYVPVTVAANTSAPVLKTSVIDAIRQQLFAGTTASFNFQMIKASYWGKEVGAQALEMTDSYSGITIQDTGSAAMRCKVGIHYPNVVQANLIYTSSGTGSLHTLYTDTAGEIDGYVTVRVWTSS